MTADEDSMKKQDRNQGFPFSFLKYGYIPCIVICFLNQISIRHLCLIYFCSETINLNL